MDQQQEQNLNSTHTAILKELSDIRIEQARATEKISNLTQTQLEMKQDIKEILDNPVLKDHENRIRTLEQFKWQVVGGFVTFHVIADYVLYLVLKK